MQRNKEYQGMIAGVLHCSNILKENLGFTGIRRLVLF
jgi:hypothetical protein